jgi:hypothetical protein
MANVKENKKIKIATMIVNATRSRTSSPLSSLAVAPFYTNLGRPFHGSGLSSLPRNVQCSNV